MAWRFKASKYKNAAPILPKPESCVRDICVGSYQTYGNNIASSAAFMAFNWEHTGSSVAVLPLDDCGRKSKTMPLLHGHTDTVTDLEFSPFHDGLLATASQDTLVKIWHIPEKGLETSLTEPECVFSHRQRRVETLGFHPTADCLLYSTAAGSVTLFDISTKKELFSNNEHPDVIQSASWCQDGTVLATSCKDKNVRIFDPRSTGSPIQMTAESHQSIKDSRVVWLGSQPRILTTGFDAARVRQVIIRDIRNFGTIEKTLELDCSTGILMPLFDADTNMLFLAGKGDTTINYLEVTDKEPYLIEGLRHTGEQTKGACLVPKRALKVMEAEVNRVLQLTSNTVIPIMYQVPRKSYRDFHADLYPDTAGFRTELMANEWFNGTNMAVQKMQLDPAQRELGDAPIIIHRGTLGDMVNNIENQKTSNAMSMSMVSSTNMQRNGGGGNSGEGVSKRNDNDRFVVRKNQNFEEKNGNAAAADDNNSGGGIKKYSESHKEIIRKFESNAAAHGHGHTNTPPSQPRSNISSMESPTENSTGSSEETSLSMNSPPKPMPRTSHNNSLQDVLAPVGGAATFMMSESPDSSSGVPRPRPRTTTTVSSYKPRLGPKPFSSNSADVSFDKVFAVPLAPGSQENIEQLSSSPNVTTATAAAPAAATPDIVGSGKTIQHQQLPLSQVSAVAAEHSDHDNGINSGNGIPKTLSTSERRKSSGDDDESLDKIFEQNSESSENSMEGEDKTDAELRRLSSTRSSIAERRRIYESRSKSTVEDRIQSPIALRRDSSKSTKPSHQQTGCSSGGNSNANANSSNLVDNKRISVPEGKLLEEHRSNVSNNSSITNNGSGGNGISGTGTGGIKKSATESTFIGGGGTATKRTSTVFGKVSKFRHLKGTPGHKSTHIENLRNLSRQIPGECNGFHANHERVAVPLSGPGGKIAIFELSRPGRLPDGVIPSLVNGSNIMDFQWDPFDSKRLAVACDDGIVKLWRIAETGLNEPTNTPESELIAHLDKIYFIRFHPLASNVLITASYDMTIKLWDLKTMTEKVALTGHTDQIFDYAWSPCGNYGATVCKDGKIRVYDPRRSDIPEREGNGPLGTRGARITWAIEGQYIVCTGFDKVSLRQISVYNARKLDAPLKIASLDVSPSILIPFYDEDSSTLFATGKGDSTIYCYEITDEEPYICALSHHRCMSLHQGLSFLTKNHCDVASVEFSKAYRLTNTTIEPLSFTVPRIKNEFFQDDLFPPTLITWIPTMSSTDWFHFNEKGLLKVSLQPDGMEKLSSVQQLAHSQKKSDLHGGSGGGSTGSSGSVGGQFMTKSEFERYRQQEIQKSVSARMEYNTKLEQDEMEGVDENEWHD